MDPPKKKFFKAKARQVFPKIDPKNKIRFERNAIRKPTVVHKVIVKGATTPGE